MHQTPISLLERLRSPGDQDAWVRFVRLYTPLLYQWARRLRLDADDAADLVQDVFTVLVAKMPRFIYDPNRRFRGWLWTVAVNKLRERRRREPASIPTDIAGVDLPDGSDPAAEFTEAEYRRYVTDRALRLLQSDFDPTTWRAFWEHVPNGRTAPDVAAELGVSVGAVYAAKTRVLARLRAELRGLLD